MTKFTFRYGKAINATVTVKANDERAARSTALVRLDAMLKTKFNEDPTLVRHRTSNSEAH